MSTRAQLSETLNRLLPGEQWKRVREGILQGANYSGQRTDQLRQSIDEANRIRTGLLVNGTTTILTSTSATLSGYVWVIDFAIKQPSVPSPLTITAPHALYSREDYFIGLANGTIVYRAGSVDALGNGFPPTYDSASEVVLRIVQRNPDGSNVQVEVPESSNLIDFAEQNIIPYVTDGKLKNSGIQVLFDALGVLSGFQFPTTVKGLPGTEPDEFVTKSQLPVISQYGLLNGGTIQWSTVGLKFQWSAAVVAIGGVLNAPSTEITLATAHATLNRVDLLGWLKTGPTTAVAHVITGTPAPTFNPPPYDPTTFVLGIPVSIPAAATVPTGVTEQAVYAENTVPPEWVPSISGIGTSNPADLANPKSGTKAVKISAVETGFKQIFTRATVLDITTVSTLGLDASLIASLGAGQSWLVGFLDASGNPASNSITLQMDKSLTAYQFIAVNLAQFTFTTNSIKGIAFTYLKTKGPAVHAGIYLDNIKLQGGVAQPVTTGANGWSPIFAVVADGARRVLQVTDWTGGTGSKPASGLFLGITGFEALIANAIDVRGTAGGTGTNGWSPVFAVVSDGARRVLQVSDWIGDTGTKPTTGQFVGATGLVALIADGVDVRGTAGGAGGAGLNGWSPVFAVVSDGARRVLQVTDWTGGTGAKPTIGQYVGATGFEVLIANGVDIRGATGPAGSGGGGSTAYLTDLDSWPVLKFDKNYRYTHDMAGAVAISAQKISPLPVVGNVFKLYIKANGTNKPTLSADFTVVWDNWSNTAGHWNRYLVEWTPEGKGIVQIEQVHLGTANDGTGLTNLTISFDANYVTTHIITNSTKILLNTVGALVGFNTTLYVRADGINKPFWGSDIIVTYDNYLNTANVWNRIKLEWRPENKAIAQLINT